VVGLATDYSSMRWGVATVTICLFAMALLLLWMKRQALRVSD